MRISPVLEEVSAYPLTRLTAAKAALQERGIDVIDFGIGEPREETPAFIRAALAAALEAEPVSSYPLAAGLPELAPPNPEAAVGRRRADPFAPAYLADSSASSCP